MFELNEEIIPRKKDSGYRRQDLPQFMIPDGYITLFSTQYFIKFMKNKHPINYRYETLGRKIRPMLHNKLIIDIDTERDLELARAILK